MSRPDVSAGLRSIVSRWFPRAVLVYDAVDLHFVREERRLALKEAAPAERHIQRRDRRVEIDEMRAADVVSIVTEEERSILLGSVPNLATVILPNVHSVRTDPVPPPSGPRASSS